MNILPMIVKPAYANPICNPVLNSYCIPTLNPQQFFNSTIATIISIFFIVGILYFFWHLIFAGYHLIGSDGDPKKFESSKNEIVYSVLGIFVIFSVFAIIRLVGIVLGITGLDTLTIQWPHL